MDDIHPLENSLILSQVFYHCQPPTLLLCRRVNSQWNDLATCHLILYKNNIRLHMHFKDHMYKISRNHCQLSGTLGGLNELLKSKSSTGPFLTPFPCTAWTIEEGLAYPLLTDFLSIQGPFIKRLRLSLHSFKLKMITPIHLFCQLLLTDCPNLVHLHLVTMPRSWGDNVGGGGEIQNLFSPSTKLVKLKTLTIGDGHGCYANESILPKILKQLLDAAPNLQKCRGVEIRFLPEFIQSKKLHTIQQLMFNPDHDELSWDYFLDSNLFSQPWPNLKEFGFSFDKLFWDDPQPPTEGWEPKMASLLGKILQSNAATLEKIHRLEPLAFLPGFKLPKMTAVKYIRFGFIEDEQPRYDHLDFEMVPRGQKFFEIFPKVESIDFQIFQNGDGQEEWAQYFPHYLTDQPVTSVKSVRIYWQSDAYWIGKIGQFFPNVTRLVVELYTLDDFFPVMPTVWRSFPLVENLVVNISTDDGMEKLDEYFCFTMDVVMTGISEENCFKLKNNFEDDVVKDPHEAEREGPSILDLKNLKKLTVDIGNYDGDGPIFSVVSGLYAFQAMRDRQQVCVTLKGVRDLEGKFESAFSPVQNFVDKIHWRDFQLKETDD